MVNPQPPEPGADHDDPMLARHFLALVLLWTVPRRLNEPDCDRAPSQCANSARIPPASTCSAHCQRDVGSVGQVTATKYEIGYSTWNGRLLGFWGSAGATARW